MTEAMLDPSTLAEWTVRQRVRLQIEGVWQGGMVAEHNLEERHLSIALDKCTWLDLSHTDALKAHLQADESGSGLIDGSASPVYVVHFSETNDIFPKVAGMLMGPPDFVFGDQVPGYLAHYAKPLPERSIGTRSIGSSSGVRYGEKSFAFGDVLTWNEDSSVRAVVVRVPYMHRVPGNPAKRARKVQARRYLLLMRLLDPGTTDTLTLEPQFFSAHWLNWDRLPLSDSGWSPKDHPSAPYAPCLVMQSGGLTALHEVSP